MFLKENILQVIFCKTKRILSYFTLLNFRVFFFPQQYVIFEKNKLDKIFSVLCDNVKIIP